MKRIPVYFLISLLFLSRCLVAVDVAANQSLAVPSGPHALYGASADCAKGIVKESQPQPRFSKRAVFRSSWNEITFETVFACFLIAAFFLAVSFYETPALLRRAAAHLRAPPAVLAA